MVHRVQIVSRCDIRERWRYGGVHAGEGCCLTRVVICNSGDTCTFYCSVSAECEGENGMTISGDGTVNIINVTLETASPTFDPSISPTVLPSAQPTTMPTATPSGYPSHIPTDYP